MDLELENINTVDNALSVIQQLHGRQYNVVRDGTTGYGIIPSEAGTVVPQFASFDPNRGASGEFFHTNYDTIHPYIIESIKEIADSGITGPIGPTGPAGSVGPTGPAGTVGGFLSIQRADSVVPDVKTGTTYQNIENMSLTTPTAGDYLMIFNCYFSADTASNDISFIFNINGTDISMTERLTRTSGNSNNLAISMTHYESGVSSGVNVVVRTRIVNANKTVTTKNRELILIRTA